MTFTLAANVENLTLTGTAAINGTGNTLDNVLTGNSAINTLTGGTGNDTMIGGAGDDLYGVDAAGDVVTELASEGTDTVQSAVTYTLAANVENLTLTGAVAINGTGNTLDNVLTGNSGANVLDGSTGADTLLGGLGNDTYLVDNAGDVVTELANEGTDTVQSAIAYILGANVENLTLTGVAAIAGTGNTLNNILVGNDGANTLNGGAGADTMSGGLGGDLYVVDHLGDVVTEALNEGTDRVLSSLTYTLGANVELLTLTGSAVINGTGNALNNVFIGNSAANVFTGGAGDDIYTVGGGDTVVENAGEGTIDIVQSDVTWTLGANIERLILTGTGAINGTGNSENNLLTGNSAANTLAGGVGNDIYIVSAGDTVVENVGEGTTDTVQSDVTWTLGANIERLTLTGTAAINGTGNALNNVFIGNSAANVFTGGAGDDIYTVGVGDTVVENVGEGTIDIVQSDVTWTLGANIERLILTGTAAVNGTGNSENNILTGNSAANTLAGGVGNDIYIVSTGDNVVENVGEGTTDTVQSDVTWTLGANIERLTLTGTGAINGTGNALGNILTGNSAANVLDGGAGADTMIGGAGDDIYGVDVAGDVVTEVAAAGTDTVQSAVTYTLAANVENLTLTGAAVINGTGNTLDNVLIGNSGVNVLDGSTGADTLLGGLGNDTYVIDNVGDITTENLNEGTDTVQSSVTWTLGANIEYLTLTGAGAINGTGNSLSNTLTGNSAANILTGGAGHDTYIVGAGDTAVENAAEGTDLVQSDATWTLGANIEYLTLIGAGAINGTGNSLNNTLTGNSAANILTGGAGNDTLAGGLGNDTYLVNRGDGQEMIQDADSTAGNADTLLYGATINPLDLVLSRQVNDLRIALYGGTEQVTIQNWYTSPTANQVETIQAGNGQTLLSTQVDQLIQAMANFSTQTGLTWEQGIAQQPQNVQAVLAASWQ